MFELVGRKRKHNSEQIQAPFQFFLLIKVMTDKQGKYKNIKISITILEAGLVSGINYHDFNSVKFLIIKLL